MNTRKQVPANSGILKKAFAGFKKIAIVIAVIAVVVELVFVLPRERNLQRTHLQATIANLVAQNPKDFGVISPAIQHILNAMHEDGVSLSGVTIPHVYLEMANFENSSWFNSNMDGAEFICSYSVDDAIHDWEEGAQKTSFCAQLRNVNFSDVSLHRTRFKYADLRDADFNTVDLAEAQFEQSTVSNSVFSGAIRLRGIEIKDSDFSDIKFRSKGRFECTVEREEYPELQEECPELQWSDFSGAEMIKVNFRGAEVDNVDFTGANMKGAKFDCEGVDGEPCTTLDGICLQNTDLSKAYFDGIKISNIDFTHTNLSGSKFKNVTFENVVFPESVLQDVDRLDDESKESLANAKRKKLVFEERWEMPCSTEWRNEIRGWLGKFETG